MTLLQHYTLSTPPIKYFRIVNHLAYFGEIGNFMQHNNSHNKIAPKLVIVSFIADNAPIGTKCVLLKQFFGIKK